MTHALARVSLTISEDSTGTWAWPTCGRTFARFRVTFIDEPLWGMSFSPAAAWHRTECGLSTDDVAKASGGTGIGTRMMSWRSSRGKGGSATSRRGGSRDGSPSLQWRRRSERRLELNLLRVVKDRSAASECVEHVRPAPVLEFVAHAPTADVPQSHFMDHVADIPFVA